MKTTTDIDTGLRRAAEAAALRLGLEEHQVHEEALRTYLGWDVLDDLLARHSDLTEESHADRPGGGGPGARRPVRQAPGPAGA